MLVKPFSLKFFHLIKNLLSRDIAFLEKLYTSLLLNAHTLSLKSSSPTFPILSEKLLFT